MLIIFIFPLAFRTSSTVISEVEEEHSEKNDNDDEELGFPLPLSSPSTSTSRPSLSQLFAHRKKSLPSIDSPFENAVTAYLEAKTAQASSASATPPEDNDYLFFKSLVPLMKKLPDIKKEEMKLQIHSLILNAVFEASPKPQMQKSPLVTLLTGAELPFKSASFAKSNTYYST
jgi:hypothetical protein